MFVLAGQGEYFIHGFSILSLQQVYRSLFSAAVLTRVSLPLLFIHVAFFNA